MRLTNQSLRRLIKEELEALIAEQPLEEGFFDFFNKDEPEQSSAGTIEDKPSELDPSKIYKVITNLLIQDDIKKLNQSYRLFRVFENNLLEDQVKTLNTIFEGMHYLRIFDGRIKNLAGGQRNTLSRSQSRHLAKFRSSSNNLYRGLMDLDRELFSAIVKNEAYKRFNISSIPAPDKITTSKAHPVGQDFSYGDTIGTSSNTMTMLRNMLLTGEWSSVEDARGVLESPISKDMLDDDRKYVMKLIRLLDNIKKGTNVVTNFDVLRSLDVDIGDAFDPQRKHAKKKNQPIFSI
tara:strand:+ start:381 stop:1256 length:876 start_codon:yes stop_codon:yes gene_type:complete